MALTKLTTDLNNISALVPEPNDVGGLTASTLQSRFDKAGNDIKMFINNTLTVETDEAIANVEGAGRTTETVKGAYDALVTHKLLTTADHDGRYYTETEVDGFTTKLTGNQTIAGVKTFSSSPIVPTPTTDMQASTKKYVDDNFTTKSEITTNRKLSATGNFTGTLNGAPITSTDPGLSSTVVAMRGAGAAEEKANLSLVNAHLAETTSEINAIIANVLTKLSKADLQALIGFADINKNISQIDSTMLNSELLAMIAGTAGVNVTPSALSVLTGMLANLSVTPIKTDFFDIVNGLNIFNKDDPDIIIDSYLTKANVITASATYFITGYLPVVEGDVIIASTDAINKQNLRFITAFNASKELMFSSGSDVASLTSFTILSGVAFVRLSLAKSPCYTNINTLQVESSLTTTPTSYLPFGYETDYIKSENLDLSTMETAISNLESTVGVLQVKDSASDAPFLDLETYYYLDSDMITARIKPNDLASEFRIIRDGTSVVGTKAKLDFVNFATNSIGFLNPMLSIVDGVSYSIKSQKVVNFTLISGREYIVESSLVDGYKSKLKITDALTLQSDFLESTSDMSAGYGIRSYRVFAGSIDVYRFRAYSLQPNDCKVLIAGDSFIAGNQLWDYKDTRYAKLIKDNLGGSAFLSGFPGAPTSKLIDLFTNYLTKLCKPKYVLLEIGTNDVDYPTYLANMQSLIATIVSMGAVPILTTITPRLDTVAYQSCMVSANNWVRGSGYMYIDFNRIATTSYNGVDQNTSLFLADKVHPTDAFQQVMYQKALVDVPELFL